MKIHIYNDLYQHNIHENNVLYIDRMLFLGVHTIHIQTHYNLVWTFMKCFDIGAAVVRFAAEFVMNTYQNGGRWLSVVLSVGSTHHVTFFEKKMGHGHRGTGPLWLGCHLSKSAYHLFCSMVLEYLPTKLAHFGNQCLVWSSSAPSTPWRWVFHMWKSAGIMMPSKGNKGKIKMVETSS